MRSLAIAALALAFLATPAIADEDVSEAEGKSIQDALKAWGCEGGDMEKEPDAGPVYEVDDANCVDGEYDIKLDQNFKVLLISRH